MPTAYYVNTAGQKVTLPETVHNHDTAYAPAAHTHTDDTGWLTLGLTNDWKDYGSGFETAGYRRLNGVVYLKGLVRRGPGTTTPPVTGDVIAVLPPGFRPLATHLFVSANQFTTGGVYYHAQRLDIGAGGHIQPQYYNDRDGDTWTSLSGISFIAEQ